MKILLKIFQNLTILITKYYNNILTTMIKARFRKKVLFINQGRFLLIVIRSITTNY